MSRSQVRVHGRRRKNVAKVVGATSSEVFLVVIRSSEMDCTGELCRGSVVAARDSCSLKSSVTDHRHHTAAHHPLQQPQNQLHPTSQLHQSMSHQTNTGVAVARSLQQSCYDEQRRLHTHQHRQQQQPETADTDRVVAPSSADCIGLQPQQRVAAAGADAVLRHSRQLDQYGETAAPGKLIKSEPSESALAAAAAAAVVSAAAGGARELADPKTGGAGGGRPAVGSKAASMSVDNAVDSRRVSSTSPSSSSLNDVISRHHHPHQHHPQQTGEMHQTSGSCSFSVSSLVHPTTGSGAGSDAGAFASVVDGGALGRDVSVDGILNAVDRGGGVVDPDSTCFDPSTAAAAAQWFAHQQGAQQAGYSSRRTPEFYMQRLHASIAADRRHSVATAGLSGDADGAVSPPPTFGHHAGNGGYVAAAAAWYSAAQPSDVICSPTAGSGAYIGDVFDVSAATRMLSGRQSCAQLQTGSPFHAYYGTVGGAINAAPAAYAAYAEDCAASGKY